MKNPDKKSIDHEKFGLLLEKINNDELHAIVWLSILVVRKKNPSVFVLKTINELFVNLQEEYNIYFFTDASNIDKQSEDSAYLLVSAIVILLKAFKLIGYSKS